MTQFDGSTETAGQAWLDCSGHRAAVADVDWVEMAYSHSSFVQSTLAAGAVLAASLCLSRSCPRPSSTMSRSFLFLCMLLAIVAMLCSSLLVTAQPGSGGGGGGGDGGRGGAGSNGPNIGGGGGRGGGGAFNDSSAGSSSTGPFGRLANSTTTNCSSPTSSSTNGTANSNSTGLGRGGGGGGGAAGGGNAGGPGRAGPGGHHGGAPWFNGSTSSSSGAFQPNNTAPVDSSTGS